MHLLFFVTSLSMIWKFSHAIQCYYCEPEMSETAFDRASVRLCAHFNKTDDFFVKECEKSTMCFKRVVTLDLGNGDNTVAVTRDCASQTYENEQKLVNRHWEKVKIIHEVYDEECTENGVLDKVTKTTDCYCRGGLCNGSDSIKSTVAGFMWIVLLLYCLN